MFGPNVLTGSFLQRCRRGRRQHCAGAGPFRFQADDTVVVLPLKTDGKSMQAKLGGDTAQFAAEHADRFRPPRPKPVTRDFHDNLIELLGLARPVDSPLGESEHDGRHRRIFEERVCGLLAVVLVPGRWA